MFYTQGATTNNFKKIEWGEKQHFIISNDSLSYSLTFNFDGGIIEMMLKPNEALEFQWFCESQEIFVKDYIPGTHVGYRIWAWGGTS